MLARIRPKLTYANVMATLAVFIALGGGAYAVTLGRDDVKSRHIAPGQVKLSDTNDRLRLKCPAGTRYHEGACFETSVRTDPGTTAATWVDARGDCADEGRRLPTSPELETFRSEPGIIVGGEDSYQEWTSSWWYDRSSAGDFYYAAVLEDNGDYGPMGIVNGNEMQYRCVAAAKR